MALVNIVSRFSFGKEPVETGLYNADASDVAEMSVSVLVANVVNDGMMLVDARKPDKELALFQYIRLL
ncbi:mucin-3A [Biomphalaria pfeifferi]|uniref:Mucin-3A n=1 Tax=Biomphalaria pfeifferi TaxID=112525 RepID=A0AAD8F516_BIOPF|nr:mucin-3A [Biomphalaria pfeifferi]